MGAREGGSRGRGCTGRSFRYARLLGADRGIAARELPRVSARSDGAHRDARAPRPAPTHPTTRPVTYLDVPSLLERTASARCRLPVHVDTAACALRGTQVGVMSGTKAQQAREMMAGVRPARAEQRKPPGATSAAAGRSLTSALLGVPSTAGSQQRRPNARCAAVGEASEASRDADVTVAHAHAQRHGCLSARWAQTRHAC